MTGSSDPAQQRWFVAYVKSCQERKAVERLSLLGIESYLPLQREVHQWSDRRKLVERLVIPGVVFVKCSEQDRRMVAAQVWQISAFMFERGEGKPAVVRDSEMESFRMMVEHGQRQVSMLTGTLAPGDRVVVVSGPLSGFECELVSVDGRRCLAMRLGTLGMATMDLSVDSIRKIGNL